MLVVNQVSVHMHDSWIRMYLETRSNRDLLLNFLLFRHGGAWWSFQLLSSLILLVRSFWICLTTMLLDDYVLMVMMWMSMNLFLTFFLGYSLFKHLTNCKKVSYIIGGELLMRLNLYNSLLFFHLLIVRLEVLLRFRFIHNSLFFFDCTLFFLRLLFCLSFRGLNFVLRLCRRLEVLVFFILFLLF